MQNSKNNMLRDIVSSQKLQKEEFLALTYIDRTKEPFAGMACREDIEMSGFI